MWLLKFNKFNLYFYKIYFQAFPNKICQQKIPSNFSSLFWIVDI